MINLYAKLHSIGFVLPQRMHYSQKAGMQKNEYGFIVKSYVFSLWLVKPTAVSD